MGGVLPYEWQAYCSRTKSSPKRKFLGRICSGHQGVVRADIPAQSPKAGHNKAGRSDFRNQRFKPDTGKTRKMRKVPLTPAKQGSDETPQSKNAENAENADTKKRGKCGWLALMWLALPQESFRAILTSKDYFKFSGYFKWPQKMHCKTRENWPFSGLFFDFRAILTSKGCLLKLTLKDSQGRCPPIPAQDFSQAPQNPGKQAFRRGHPWPEGADVHDPKGHRNPKYQPFWESPFFYKAPPRQFQPPKLNWHPPKCKSAPSKM